ncbi:MAG TPA: hypothetical protein VI749_04565 [Candidatus Omnitrophota bacterium]|nr:hypothetical protein [Candidatus Omnitrophota bacterium]
MSSSQIDALVRHLILSYFDQFLIIGVVVYVLLAVLMVISKKPRSLSLLIICSLLATSCVYDFFNLVDYGYQRQLFLPMPEWVFQVRFCFSILLRSALIAISVGLIYRNELARKAVIAIAVFTIATIYWKHPYYVFENIAIMVEQQYFGAPIKQLQFPEFPRISMLVYIAVDLIIAGVLIYYFTLPSVVRFYKKDESKAQKT